MIKRKKKICKGCNKERYLFGKGLCERCYKLNQITLSKRKIPAKNSRSIEKSSKIPPRTKKRLQQELEYLKLIKEIDKEAKENKKMECFFCNKKVENAQHHHLDGREEDLLLNKDNIVRVHYDCHMDYHNKSVSKIKWFDDYLKRIKKEYPGLYEKEIFKLNK